MIHSFRTPPPGPLPNGFPARWASDWGEDPAGLWQAFTYRGVRQAFRWMPPGRFHMGSPENEHARDNDELQHEVSLTRGFWLADTACTQALWEAVTGGNPSRFTGERRPVENVSWDAVQEFIGLLNKRIPGLNAFLPTEAEWEYACRAGTKTPFSFGDDITPEQVNFEGRSPYRGDKQGLYRGETVEVASLPPSPWGLYEIHGNVWEWCHDWYGDYPKGPAADPMGPDTGSACVLRGGSWFDGGLYVRSAFRRRLEPGDCNGLIGFRLALGPELKREQARVTQQAVDREDDQVPRRG